MNRSMIERAVRDSFVKLDPRTQAENPVMFLVYLSAIAVTVLWIIGLFGWQDASSATPWRWH
jgi:K+-transporting ATPase ATPase B chain